MSRRLTNHEFDYRIRDFKIKRLGNYISSNTKIDLLCLVCGDTFSKAPSDIFTYSQCKNGCPKCMRIQAKKSLKETLGITNQSVDDRLKDYKVKRVGDVGLTREKTLFYCTLCKKEFYQSLNSVLQGHSKNGCPECNFKIRGKKLQLTNEDVTTRLLEKNIILKEIYKPNKKLELECNICKYIWVGNISPLIHGRTDHGCPKCNSNRTNGEIYMAEILKDLNIEYIQQKSYPELKNKYILRFDFYLPNLNTLIEIDGGQHYYPVMFSSNMTHDESIEDFNLLRKKDLLKNNFCLKNQIKLIRIPFKVQKKYTNIPPIKNKGDMWNFITKELNRV